MAVIKRTTYKDQVVEYIYDLVLDGKFVPGDHLKESLLAKELGISRAPVREAFRELISMAEIGFLDGINKMLKRLEQADGAERFVAIIRNYLVSYSYKIKLKQSDM